MKAGLSRREQQKHGDPCAGKIRSQSGRITAPEEEDGNHEPRHGGENKERTEWTVSEIRNLQSHSH